MISPHHFILFLLFSPALLAQTPPLTPYSAQNSTFSTNSAEPAEQPASTRQAVGIEHMPLIMQQMMRRHHQQTQRGGKASAAELQRSGKF